MHVSDLTSFIPRFATRSGSEVSVFDKPLAEWWDRCSDGQKEALADSANANRMDEDTILLLFNTRCPIGPVGSKWAEQPDYSWNWPSTAREFVRAQL